MRTVKQGSDPSREEIRAAIDRVLEHPDFGGGEETEGESWLDGLFDGAEESGSTEIGQLEGVADLAEMVLLIGGVVLVGLVLASLAFQIRKRFRPEAVEGDELRRERTVAEMLGRAREAREGGDPREALRWAFGALVLGWARGGRLEWKPSYTHRELIARGQPEPEVRAWLDELVVGVDARVFGREPTTEADLERVFELCDRLPQGGRDGAERGRGFGVPGARAQGGGEGR